MVQISVMYLIAFELAYTAGKITKEQCEKYTEELLNIPEVIKDALELKDNCSFVASKLLNAESLLYIGRGLDYALSMEGSLKLKEISYIHSESYAAGELKHGYNLTYHRWNACYSCSNTDLSCRKDYK